MSLSESHTSELVELSCVSVSYILVLEIIRNSWYIEIHVQLCKFPKFCTKFIRMIIHIMIMHKVMIMHMDRLHIGPSSGATPEGLPHNALHLPGTICNGFSEHPCSLSMTEVHRPTHVPLYHFWFTYVTLLNLYVYQDGTTIVPMYYPLCNSGLRLPWPNADHPSYINQYSLCTWCSNAIVNSNFCGFMTNKVWNWLVWTTILSKCPQSTATKGVFISTHGFQWQPMHPCIRDNMIALLIVMAIL